MNDNPKESTKPKPEQPAPEPEPQPKPKPIPTLNPGTRIEVPPSQPEREESDETR
jgi:hypothetical protein